MTERSKRSRRSKRSKGDGARHVRTPEGAKRYGEAIGAKIELNADGTVKKVTPTGPRSTQDKAAIKEVQAEATNKSLAHPPTKAAPQGPKHAAPTPAPKPLAGITPLAKKAPAKKAPVKKAPVKAAPKKATPKPGGTAVPIGMTFDPVTDDDGVDLLSKMVKKADQLGADSAQSLLHDMIEDFAYDNPGVEPHHVASMIQEIMGNPPEWFDDDKYRVAVFKVIDSIHDDHAAEVVANTPAKKAVPKKAPAKKAPVKKAAPKAAEKPPAAPPALTAVDLLFDASDLPPKGLPSTEKVDAAYKHFDAAAAADVDAQSLLKQIDASARTLTPDGGFEGITSGVRLWSAMLERAGDEGRDDLRDRLLEIGGDDPSDVLSTLDESVAAALTNKFKFSSQLDPNILSASIASAAKSTGADTTLITRKLASSPSPNVSGPANKLHPTGAVKSQFVNPAIHGTVDSGVHLDADEPITVAPEPDPTTRFYDSANQLPVGVVNDSTAPVGSKDFPLFIAENETRRWQEFGAELTNEDREDWTDDQYRAVYSYTQESGTANDALRDGGWEDEDSEERWGPAWQIRQMDELFDNEQIVTPFDRHAVLTRGTDGMDFGLPSRPSNAQWRDLVDQTITNLSFTSASVTNNPAFGGSVRVVYLVPPGIKGIYVSGDAENPAISSYGSDEREVILQRGLTYTVKSATPSMSPRFQWDVIAEVHP